MTGSATPHTQIVIPAKAGIQKRPVHDYEPYVHASGRYVRSRGHVRDTRIQHKHPGFLPAQE